MLSRDILHLFLVLSLIGLNYIYLYGDTSINIYLSTSFFRVVLVQRINEKRMKAKVLHCSFSFSMLFQKIPPVSVFWASLIAQLVKNPSAMQENNLKARKVIQIMFSKMIEFFFFFYSRLVKTPIAKKKI